MLNYCEFLKTEIFKVDQDGQFKLLFDLIDKINAKNHESIVVLERSYIYSGLSIFYPLLTANSINVLDYRSSTAEERQGFQYEWLGKYSKQLKQSDFQIVDLNRNYYFDFEDLEADALFVPNVLHHCRDFKSMIAGILERCKKLEHIYVFDSYVREQHQFPDDYCRYTVPALNDVLKDFDFFLDEEIDYGNIFDGIIYLVRQASKLLNTHDELREIKELTNELVPKLRNFSENPRYQSLGRPNASYTSAYAVSFRKNYENS